MIFKLKLNFYHWLNMNKFCNYATRFSNKNIKLILEIVRLYVMFETR